MRSEWSASMLFFEAIKQMSMTEPQQSLGTRQISAGFWITQEILIMLTAMQLLSLQGNLERNT